MYKVRAGVIAATALIAGVADGGAAQAAPIVEEYTYYNFIHSAGPLTEYIEWDDTTGGYTSPVAYDGLGLGMSLWITTSGLWLDPLRGQTLVFSGSSLIANGPIRGSDVDGYIESEGGLAGISGTITFDEFQNIVGWNLATSNPYGDNCGTLGQAGGLAGGSFCEDTEQQRNYSGNIPGEWSLAREYAERVFLGDEYEDGYEVTPVPRPVIITNPGDLGGGGGLPGPIPLPPSPVPLPASVLLLLSGIGALGVRGVWRRRRAAA